MNIGDLVRNYMTEQIGIVVDESCTVYDNGDGLTESQKPHSFQVMWTTHGDEYSTFGTVGTLEWTGPTFVEVISEGR